jgi:hypothetical protein
LDFQVLDVQLGDVLRGGFADVVTVKEYWHPPPPFPLHISLTRSRSRSSATMPGAADAPGDHVRTEIEALGSVAFSVKE